MEKELFGDIAADGGGAEDGETLHQFQNLTGHKIYTQHLGTLHALHMSSYFGCRQPTETTATPAAEIPVLEDENLHQFQNLTGHKIYSQHLGILHDLHMSSYFGCRHTAEPAAPPAAEIPVPEDENLHLFQNLTGHKIYNQHLGTSHDLHMSSYFGCRQTAEPAATPAAESPVPEDENLHLFQNLTGHKIYNQHLGTSHDLHVSSYFGCRQTAEPAAAPAAEIPVSEDQNLHRIRIQSGPTSEHLHLSISASGVFVNIFYVVAGQGVATVRL